MDVWGKGETVNVKYVKIKIIHMSSKKSLVDRKICLTSWHQTVSTTASVIFVHGFFFYPVLGSRCSWWLLASKKLIYTFLRLGLGTSVWYPGPDKDNSINIQYIQMYVYKKWSLYSSVKKRKYNIRQKKEPVSVFWNSHKTVAKNSAIIDFFRSLRNKYIVYVHLDMSYQLFQCPLFVSYETWPR